MAPAYLLHASDSLVYSMVFMIELGELCLIFRNDRIQTSLLKFGDRIIVVLIIVYNSSVNRLHIFADSSG